MKVLLISIDSKFIHSNLAVHSLKAYAEKKLRESGAFCDIAIAEYTINQQPAKVLADIYKRDADVIMFSCYIWNKTFMSKLLDDLAIVKPDIDIWLGGPEVSFDGNDVLEEFKNLRGIMSGEGEESFAQLIMTYTSGVAGIISQSEPLDMDELPFAYGDLSGFENRVIYYESSRGCPYRCSYCLSSVDKKLRFRSLGIVKEELKFFLDKRVPQVKFVDRTFNCDHRRTMEIWQFLKDNDNGITNFHFEMAADILNEDEIKLLADLRPGQVQLEIGVQTTNCDTLEAIERPMDFEKLCENVAAIKEAGNVHLHLDLIAGLPYEDIKSFEKSFNDVFGLRPEQLQLGFLKVLKGSPMASRCEEYGLKYTAQPPYEVLETKWISYEELLELKRIEEMVEVYYNTGQFAGSLEVLLGAFDSAFEMFGALGEFYEARGLEMMNLGRNSRYEMLLEFGREVMSEADLTEALILDYYSRENAKTRPAFLGEETVSKEFAKEFYSIEAREHKYLTSRELIDCDDPRTLRKHTHLEKTEDGYLLFDYTRRDPLTNNALTVEVVWLADCD
ncbi:MAG: DUF4080 domain-containing protein [Bacillota bacterium]|nr:DUF4080 domain-containing protein [Bacillota bacterium]